jgi:hypothetical protein
MASNQFWEYFASGVGDRQFGSEGGRARWPKVARSSSVLDTPRNFPQSALERTRPGDERENHLGRGVHRAPRWPASRRDSLVEVNHEVPQIRPSCQGEKHRQELRLPVSSHTLVG